MHTALVIVDLASDKTVVKYVDGCINQKPMALQAKRCFVEGWLDWASRVERIQIDQDSAFRSTFSQLADDLGIAKVPLPSESHWQHGRVERKVQFLKHMSMKVQRPCSKLYCFVQSRLSANEWYMQPLNASFWF